MDNAKFWWSSSETPQPPMPPVIGESLRFRGAQILTNPSITIGNDAWTCSYWFKPSTAYLSNSRQSLVASGTTTTRGYFALYYYNNANNGSVVSLGTPAGGVTSGAYSVEKFRDPSAWYHFVMVNEGPTSCKLYVNGKLLLSNASQGWNFAGTQFEIGGTTLSSYFFDGYMADVYLIDGQALEPTAL